MKSKQSNVFDKVRDLYYPHIERWLYLAPECQLLKAVSNSPEHYHIIANAANKFYELVTLNE